MFKRVRRLRAPSLPTAISLLALSIVMTGTAWAATGQLVNLVDGTNPSNVAKVDSTGAVKATVSGSVYEIVPRTQFRHVIHVFESHGPLTPVTSATLAISRIAVSNYGDQSLRHDARVRLYQRGASNGECNGPTKLIGHYFIKAGDTLLDPLPVPMLLKPMSGSPQWCLSTDATMVGSSGSYFLPAVQIHGFVISGTYSGVSSTSREADPGDPHPMHRG